MSCASRKIVDLEDVVMVRFAVEPQTYRDLEALAFGQKCTVVLMTCLAEGDFPLLVDQPEDACTRPGSRATLCPRSGADEASASACTGP